MSTQDYPRDDQATDGDAAEQQPAEAQPAQDDEVETAVDAFVAEQEDDTPAGKQDESGE